jgi:hypothetical protein
VRRARPTRLQGVDLLTRPPTVSRTHDGWTRLVVDPVEQLRELAELCDRGLLSDEEYERQRAKVLDR